MGVKSSFVPVFLSFIAAVAADPIPQAAASTTLIATAAATTPFDTALPSSLAFIEACLSSEESIYADVPTLPASIEAVLQTAVPTSVETLSACAEESAIESYYANLPKSIQSAISSYSSAVESWYSAHSSELDALASSCTVSGGSSFPTTVPATGTVIPNCAGGGTTATSTKNSGGKTTGSAGAGSTGTGSGSVTSSKSAGGAAPTGAITFGAAGMVGLLGLMVAL